MLGVSLFFCSFRNPYFGDGSNFYPVFETFFSNFVQLSNNTLIVSLYAFAGSLSCIKMFCLPSDSFFVI